MESSELLEWLISEKNMSIRSAKDVISRCGRVRRMLHTDSIHWIIYKTMMSLKRVLCLSSRS